MTALLERLNASRRFARSVYAPHKLALRQGVPSALRALGVSAPAPQVLSAARSVPPRALRAAAPVEARGDAAPKLEPQGLVNLAPQGSALLAVSVPLESVSLESVQELSLEDAASANLAPSEPTASPESNGAVTVEAPMPLEQSVARAAPTRAEASAALEPSAEAVAPAMRAAEAPMPTTAIDTPEPTANPAARAVTAPLGPVGETLSLVRENASAPEVLSEPERVDATSLVSETLETSPVPSLESPVAVIEPASLEPQFASSALEVAEAVPTVREAATLEAAMLEVSLAPMAANLEVAAPAVADESAPSPAPIQPTARGRVIEEFQARPPRNMPPRNQPPRAAEPEPAAVNATPQRSPEEWARLLRQRFAQPGDEAFDDAVTPAAPAVLMPAPLEPAALEPAPLMAAPSNSSAPTLSPEPRANIVAPLDGRDSASDDDSSQAVSALEIRERSLAALQAIPEDMTKRSPRDWGLALIRRYASLDEAAAIGIEAYRDPNDAAATQTPPGEPAQSVPARATVLGSVSNSSASSSPASSSPEQAVPIGLEMAAHPARRFVAPRIVSSTAPGFGTVAPSLSAQPVRPASPQRSAPSPAPLEQSSSALEAAPPVSALLEPSRPAIAPDSSVDAPLETAIVAAPQTDAAPDSAVLDDAQLAGAAVTSEASSGANPSLTIAQNDAALFLTPTLEPVHLSGATRRFLEPLVGFDPNEVSVYTGEGASRVTRDLHADAAAQHGAVLLPDASNLETPAQLGLLAHELIHAAQQQSAVAPPAASLEPTLESPVQTALESPGLFESVSRRFVPAVGSSDTRGAAPSSSAAQTDVAGQSSNPRQFSNTVRQSSAPLLTDISGFASEEDRARTAEARVTRIARAGPLSPVPTSAESTSAEPPNAPTSWNGLPAPWESLPSLESPASDDGVVSLIGAGLSPRAWGGSATTTNPVGYGGSVSSSSPGASSGSASNAAQAAEIGRELPAETSEAAAVAPDLEQLAKQVYDVLKRRLQSDRRRSGA